MQVTWSALWLVFLLGSWKFGLVVVGNFVLVVGAAMLVVMVVTL